MFLSGKSARKNTQANVPSALNLFLFGSHFYLKRFFKKTNKKKLQHHSLRHFADGAHSLLNIKKTHISYLTQQGNRIHIFCIFFSFWMLFYFRFVWDTNIGNTNLALIAFFVIVYKIFLFFLFFLKKNMLRWRTKSRWGQEVEKSNLEWWKVSI